MRYVEPIREVEWQDEFETYFKENNQRNYILYVFGIETGLRISDMLPLRKKDVIGSHLNMVEKKTKKQKRIKLSQFLKDELDKYTRNMRNVDFLFPSQKKTDLGKPKAISRIRVDQILKDAAEAIGYYETISAHSLRKTFGYNFYREFGDVASLMKIFNHSRETVTLFYIGVGQDDIDEKVAGLRKRKNMRKK